MLTGMLVVVGCGVAYLFAENFWSLAIVRIVNGAGMFLVMASCMVRLVAIIPPDKTGLAFSLYSVALLLPYSIMPAVSEMVMPQTDKPTIIYMLTAGLLLPAVILVLRMRTRASSSYQAPQTKSEKTYRKNFKWLYTILSQMIILNSKINLLRARRSYYENASYFSPGMAEKIWYRKGLY